MSARPDTPPPMLEQSGELRALRLVGSSETVRWVALALERAGRLVERFEAGDPNAPKSFGRGPVMWVVRPQQTGTHAWPPVSDSGVWTFPCLIVVPPGGELPFSIPGQISVESFDIVREPEDAPVLALRVDRLLQLHRRRSQTETVLQNLSDIIYTRKFDGTLTSINKAGERLFGKRREELIGRRLPELAALTTPDILFATNTEIQMRGRLSDRRNVVDRDGRARIFDSEVLLLRDSYGQPSGVQVILTDITEEHEFREGLKREAQRNEILAAIASAARDSLDLDEVLNAATGILGSRLAADSVEVWFLNEERTACRVVLHWRATDTMPSLVGLERTLAESVAFSQLVKSLQPYVIPDGNQLDPESLAARVLKKLDARSVAGVPICRSGEMIGVLAITWKQPRAFTSDELVFFGRVADQIALAIRAARLYANLQEQLRALAVAQHRREEADRDRSRLTAMLVHDLKNPLAAVTAALELTRDKALSSGDARLARMLDGSLGSARGLQGLIEDALLVYRPEDAPEPEKSPVSPADALAQPLEEMRWLARARRIRLEVEVPSTLPAIPLDAPRFRRAVANLVGNAVKFAPPQSVVEVVAGIEDLPGGRQFYVRVTDTGPGVPPSLRNRIATPYLRLPGSEEVPGTGLGLTVVQRVAQAHGGRVEVGSNQGVGSVFTIWIPC